MKTYTQLVAELNEEATARQRAIGVAAAAGIAMGGLSMLDKKPADHIQYKDSKGKDVVRQIIKTKPAANASGEPFEVKGKKYTPYFPNLAHEQK